MSRRNLLASISLHMQKGPFEAFTLAGIKEQQISKYIHSFKEDFEGEQIRDFVKSTKDPCQKLLTFYRELSPAEWARMELDPLPEIAKLKKAKTKIRKLWVTRPRFKIARAKRKG